MTTPDPKNPRFAPVPLAQWAFTMTVSDVPYRGGHTPRLHVQCVSAPAASALRGIIARGTRHGKQVRLEGWAAAETMARFGVPEHLIDTFRFAAKLRTVEACEALHEAWRRAVGGVVHAATPTPG